MQYKKAKEYDLLGTKKHRFTFTTLFKIFIPIIDTAHHSFLSGIFICISLLQVLIFLESNNGQHNIYADVDKTFTFYNFQELLIKLINPQIFLLHAIQDSPFTHFIIVLALLLFHLIWILSLAIF